MGSPKHIRANLQKSSSVHCHVRASVTSTPKSLTITVALLRSVVDSPLAAALMRPDSALPGRLAPLR